MQVTAGSSVGIGDRHAGVNADDTDVVDAG